MKYSKSKCHHHELRTDKLLAELQGRLANDVVPFKFTLEHFITPNALCKAYFARKTDKHHQSIRDAQSRARHEFTITRHVYERFIQRVTYNNKPVTKNELQEIAYKAKTYGISLSDMRLKDINNDAELYHELMNNYDCVNEFGIKKSTSETYFYNDFLFCYAGRKSRVLTTVMMPRVIQQRYREMEEMEGSQQLMVGIN